MATAHPQGLGSSFVTGVNAHGTICGFRSIGSPESTFYPWTAFTWSAKNGYKDVGLVNGCDTFARAISDTGVVVGTVCGQFWIDAPVRGLVVDGDEITTLGVVPGGLTSAVVAVNSLGIMVTSGLMQQSRPIATDFITQGLESTPVVRPAGFDRARVFRITDEGLIGGNCNSVSVPSPWVPYVWRGDAYLAVDVPLSVGQYISEASDMSDDGTFVLRVGNPYRCVVAGPIWAEIGDMNCDEVVNVDDLLGVINAWGPCESGCPTDFDENAVTNVQDLVIVIENWTKVQS